MSLKQVRELYDDRNRNRAVKVIAVIEVKDEDDLRRKNKKKSRTPSNVAEGTRNGFAQRTL